MKHWPALVAALSLVLALCLAVRPVVVRKVYQVQAVCYPEPKKERPRRWVV